MRLFRIFISIMICWMSLAVHAFAQEPDDLPEWATFRYPQSWITAGAGFGAGVGRGWDGTFVASVNIGLPWRGLVGQAAFSANWPVNDASAHASSVSASIGTVHSGRDFAVVFFAGPSVTWDSAGESTARPVLPGISLSTQFFVLPSMLGGAGLDLTVNVIPEQPTLGVRFLLMIGSPRPSTAR